MRRAPQLGRKPRRLQLNATRRSAWQVPRLTRSILGVVVLISGWLLGGTVVFVFLIGPLVQFFLPRCSVSTGRPEDAWGHPAR